MAPEPLQGSGARPAPAATYGEKPWVCCREAQPGARFQRTGRGAGSDPAGRQDPTQQRPPSPQRGCATPSPRRRGSAIFPPLPPPFLFPLSLSICPPGRHANLADLPEAHPGGLRAEGGAGALPPRRHPLRRRRLLALPPAPRRQPQRPGGAAQRRGQQPVPRPALPAAGHQPPAPPGEPGRGTAQRLPPAAITPRPLPGLRSRSPRPAAPRLWGASSSFLQGFAVWKRWEWKPGYFLVWCGCGKAGREGEQMLEQPSESSGGLVCFTAHVRCPKYLSRPSETATNFIAWCWFPGDEQSPQSYPKVISMSLG